MAFTHTTSTSAGAFRPDVYAFSPTDIVPDSLLLQCSTKVGVINGDAPVVRCGYVDDTTAAFVAEGDDIDESEPDLAEVLIATGKISQLIRISSEQFNQVGTADQLAMSVARSITRKCDEAFVAQAAPTPPALAPAAGLLNVDSVVEGDEVSTSLDPLIDLVATLQSNLSTPTHIILDPLGWSVFRKIKVATSYEQNLLGAGTSDAQAMMLSLPVVVNAQMTPYTGLVVDRYAVVSAYGDLTVATSYDQYFSSDSVALRAIWRVGHAVTHPTRLGKFDIAAPGS